MIRRGGNKFSAKKTPCLHGHTHDSAREAKRCNELHLLLRARKIVNLQIQPQFWFHINGKVVKHANGRRCGYRPDFLYSEYFPPDGDTRAVAEDSMHFIDQKGRAAASYDYKGGVLRRVWPAYKEYYREGFHPWHRDTRPLLASWKATDALAA